MDLREPGIRPLQISGKRMRYAPWPRDVSNGFRRPEPNEIRTTFGISGQAVRENVVYFTASGGNPRNLAALLERACPEDSWRLQAEDLLDASRWYTNEFYFFVVMFQKQLLDDQGFCYPPDEMGYLSAHHKIYERGPMQFRPWGHDESGRIIRDYSFANLTALARYFVVHLGCSLDELIEYANAFLPEGFVLENRFFSYEVFWCSMELRAYLFELFKILSNHNEIVGESMAELGLRVRYMRFVSTFPKSMLPYVLRIMTKNTTGIYETKVVAWRQGAVDLRITPTENFRKEQYGPWIRSVSREALSLCIENYSNVVQSSLGLLHRPRVEAHMEQESTNPVFLLHFTWPIVDRPGKYMIKALVALVFFMVPAVVRSFETGTFLMGWSDLIIGTGLGAFSWSIVNFRTERRDLHERLYKEGASFEENIQDLQQVTDELMRERGLLEARIRERTDELERANEHLIRLEQARSRFLERISHELHVPLSLILGPIEAIMDGRYGEYLRIDDHRIKDMHAQGLRILKRVQDLLDIAHLQSGRLKIQARPIELADLLAWCAAVARSWADERRITLNFVDKGEGIRAAVDREILEKVLFQLLSNAVRFTLPGGVVEVCLETLPGTTDFQIEVKDNGIGIPMRDLSAILHAGSDGEISRGLGLAICRDFVSLLGGTFNLTSTPDQGTTVTLHLPIGNLAGYSASDSIDGEHTGEIGVSVRADGYFADVVSDPVTETPAETAEGFRPVFAGEESTGGMLVMIDNVDLRRFVSEILTELGPVHTLPDQGVPIEEARRVEPHVIVGDLRISDPRTLLFLRALKQDKRLRSTSVVVLGSPPAGGGAPPGWEQWIDDLQPMPFRQSELKSRVKRLLWRAAEARLELDRAAVVDVTPISTTPLKSTRREDE